MFVITGEDCSDLQHLRAAHVHRRWPGRQQLRRSGNTNKIKKFVYPYASLACMLVVSTSLPHHSFSALLAPVVAS